MIAVSNLEVSSEGTITWDYTGTLPGGLAGFRIWLDGVPVALVSPPASSHSYSLTELAARHRYTVSVAAEDGAGETGDAVAVSFTALPIETVPSPAGLVATAGVQSATLVWESAGAGGGGAGPVEVLPEGVIEEGSSVPVELVGYWEVWLGGVFLAQVPITTTSYSIEGLMAGAPATFSLVRVDEFGNRSTPAVAGSVTPSGGENFIMTEANFVAISDALGKVLQRIKGNGAEYGGGGGNSVAVASDSGVSQALGELQELVVAAGTDTIRYLIAATDGARNAAAYRAQVQAICGAIVSGMNSLCYAQNLLGVYNVQSLTDFYNFGSGGPWEALHCPEFAEIWHICSGTVLQGVYAPNLTLATRNYGAAAVLLPVLDAGLYVGAARCQVVATGYTGTSGTLTVTGLARPSSVAGSLAAPISNRTFTATITSSGTFVLTPSVAGDLLMEVTGITLPGGMSGGSVAIKTLPPAGRDWVVAA